MEPEKCEELQEDLQTTFNEDCLENLVEEGCVENECKD